MGELTASDEGFVEILSEEEGDSDADVDSTASELPDLEDFETIPDDEGLGHMLDEWEDFLSGWMLNLHEKVKSLAQTPTHLLLLMLQVKPIFIVEKMMSLQLLQIEDPRREYKTVKMGIPKAPSKKI